MPRPRRECGHERRVWDLISLYLSEKFIPVAAGSQQRRRRTRLSDINIKANAIDRSPDP